MINTTNINHSSTYVSYLHNLNPILPEKSLLPFRTKKTGEKGRVIDAVRGQIKWSLLVGGYVINCIYQ